MTPPKDNKQVQDSADNKQSEDAPEEVSEADPNSTTAGPSKRSTPRPGTTNATSTPSTTPSTDAGPSTTAGESSSHTERITFGPVRTRENSTDTLTKITVSRSDSNQSIASVPLIDPGSSRDATSIAGSSIHSTQLAMSEFPSATGFPTTRSPGTSRFISTIQNSGSNNPAVTNRTVSQLEYAKKRQEDLSKGRVLLGDRQQSPSLLTLDKELKKYIQKRESSAYQIYPGTERTVYEFISERTNMYSTNLFESTAHLIKASIGAGVLTMHEAYMIGGMWTSLVATVVFGLLIAYTMYMLVRSAQKMYCRLRITKLSYPDLAEAAAATAPWARVRKLSKMFRYIVDSAIFLEMFGTCCIYQIIIAFTLKQMTEGFQHSINSAVTSEIFDDIRIYILMSAPLLIPLCLIRSIKYMAPFAMLADIFVGICVMTTLYYSLTSINDNITARPGWKNLQGFLKICAISFYSTSGICVALPVENHMRRPRQFSHALKYATIVVIILTVLTGVFGYWTWGEECKSPITVHMPLNTFTTVLQFLLVLMLSTTFAVQFWVPFRIIWHYVMKKYNRKQAIWERAFRLVMAIGVTCVTMIFPYLIAAIVFLGQFCLGFIGLVFPAIIELLVDWEEQLYSEKAQQTFICKTKNYSLVVLGLFMSISSIYFVQE